MLSEISQSPQNQRSNVFADMWKLTTIKWKRRRGEEFSRLDKGEQKEGRGDMNRQTVESIT